VQARQVPVGCDLATIAASFISLAKILPAVRPCLLEPADGIALIKPQFEVGKGEVGRGGIVTDPAKHRRVLVEMAKAAGDVGLTAVGLIESPILGAEGNREFLIHLVPAEAAANSSVDERIVVLTPRV